MNELDDANLDKSLRDKFAPYGRQPSEQLWYKINQRINPPVVAAKPVRPWLLPLLFLAGLLLLITGNLLPRVFTPELFGSLAEAPVSGTERVAQATTATVASAPIANAESGNNAIANQQKQPAPALEARSANNTSASSQTPASSSNIILKGTRLAKAQQVTAPAGLPVQAIVAESYKPDVSVSATGKITDNPTEQVALNSAIKNTEIPASLLVLVQLEQGLQPLLINNPELTEKRSRIAQNLKAQKAELTKLQQRADSLLKLVEEADYLKHQPIASADSLPIKKKTSRWSAALAYAPERSFMSLQAPLTDTLSELRRNHETGRSGYSASASIEYQLNNRLSIGAGIGLSSYGAELRLTDRETLVNVIYDTTTQTTTQLIQSTYTTVSVHIDTVYQLHPILNQGGQVVSYDTTLIISHDSTIHVINQLDSLTTIQETITPLISKTEVTTYKVLKPTYNFVTIPITLRYRLTPGARWWADVAVGAQLQFFRGGTQVVTTDGRYFQTQKISSREGPFRPVNLALMGSMAMNYALTERLSVSVAPALRWQTMSVYKKETQLKQQPIATGLQFGVRYAF